MSAGLRQGAAIYDAHIHLTDLAYEPIIDTVMNSMNALDIVAFCVSTSVQDSVRTVSLAKNNDRIAGFVGIHPDNASDDYSEIAKIVSENTVEGIGEIGLDPTVTDDDGYKKQFDVFRAMLSLAEKKNLPISIHSRKSLEDVLDVISTYKIRASLLHWFDGNKGQLRRAMDMGLYVSYGPVSVYAADKRVLMSRTDPDKILVETDGPVRFSRCFDHASAQPCHIPSVIHCAAQSLDTSYEKMRNILATNSQNYLG